MRQFRTRAWFRRLPRSWWREPGHVQFGWPFCRQRQRQARRTAAHRYELHARRLDLMPTRGRTTRLTRSCLSSKPCTMVEESTAGNSTIDGDCPLWVGSGHYDVRLRCLLGAKSGHSITSSARARWSSNAARRLSALHRVPVNQPLGEPAKRPNRANRRGSSHSSGGFTPAQTR